MEIKLILLLLEIITLDLKIIVSMMVKIEQFLIDWSLRLDLFVSGLIIVITFFATIFTIYLISVYEENKFDLKIIKNSSLSIFGILNFSPLPIILSM